MAQHFYVKDTLGTRTADTSFTAAEPATAFGSGNLTAANCYANLGVLAGLTTIPGDGDFVYCSDLHNASYDNLATYTLNDTGAIDGAGLRIYSVDDANCTLYKPGAADRLNDGTDEVQIDNNGHIAGVAIGSTDDGLNAAYTMARWIIQDTTLVFGITATDNALGLTRDGSILILINVDIDYTGTTQVTSLINKIDGASTLLWLGGKVTASGGSTIKYLTGSTTFKNGGGFFIAVGVDLSKIVSRLDYGLFGSSADNALIRLDNCVIYSGITLPSYPLSPLVRLEFFGTDDTTGNKSHRILVTTYSGKVRNNDSVYAIANDVWYEGTDKSSLEVQTNSKCSKVHPFSFNFPANEYVDLGNVATDKITLNLVSNFQLTDTDIAAFIRYADGTTEVISGWLSSGVNVGAGNYGTDPLAAGTNLPASSLGAADWTGEPASPIFSKLELDLVGLSRAMPIVIRIEVYKASIDGTTNKLFIDSELEIGT